MLYFPPEAAMTVTVDIANPGVLNLLRDLEGLKLLRLAVPARPAAEGGDWFENGGECPLCAQYTDPATGEPRLNDETIAAIEEGNAMERGAIPANRFHSFEEMWEDLHK
jgi:hypothetical protein